jgi:hypothetical protein
MTERARRAIAAQKARIVVLNFELVFGRHDRARPRAGRRSSRGRVARAVARRRTPSHELLVCLDAKGDDCPRAFFACCQLRSRCSPRAPHADPSALPNRALARRWPTVQP